MRFFKRFFGQSQPPRRSPQGFGQTFVLEPILTPSGLLDVDGGDESPDFDSIDVPDLEPAELPDFAPHPLIDDAHLEDIDFFDADGDPELLADSTIDFDASEPSDLDSDTDVLATSDDLEAPEDSGDADDFIVPPIVASDDTKAVFQEGFFTVGASGRVGIDNLFDGGAYQGELAIFNIDGLDDFDFENPEEFRAFLLEASDRALSDSSLGHVVINDLTEGAKFSGNLPEGNFNSGEYLGVKTFEMNAGDKFAVMIVPNGSVQRIYDILSAGEDLPFDLQPLFSLGTANPNDTFHMAQIADVTGDGSTFGMEDLRTDGWTDRDYNDLVFQVRGATGKASLMDEVVNPNSDWRGTEIGQALIEYAKPYIEPEVVDVSPDVPLDPGSPLPDVPLDSDPLPEVPREQQPLIGVIDTGFSENNPDLDYSRIILGQDRIDNDANPLLNAGQGSEHGTHILGVIGATQDNGVGIDGINDTAPIWVGRAIGSGEWADSLVEFVDAAVESGQPNAVVNLSLDLTQVNPDGSVTTRYEFTPQERAAIEYARQHNVLMVVAAGNDGGVMSALGQSSQEFDNIITVGAAERVNDAVASSNAYDRVDYSSYGYGLDIMAPGGSVSNPELSLTGDGVGTMAGTSVATAKVTGAVSQVWAANPGLSYRQVIEILKDTATDLKQTGWDTQSGAGLLNMAAAIHLARATQPEEYEVLPTLIPDTWGGEGKVTPMERAAAGIIEGSFSAWIKSTNGINLRFVPLLSERSPNSIGSFREELTFDAWTYGEPVSDLPVDNYPGGALDAMWFRYQYENQAYWIPSAYVVGYPPGNYPSLPPDGNVGYDGTWYHSTYINTFHRNGSQSTLGSPTNNVHPWENGYTQEFSGGSDGTGAIMKSNANDNSYWVGGEFWNKLLNAGGAGGSFGYPTSDRYQIDNGWRQDFQGGSITIQNSTNSGSGGNTNPNSETINGFTIAGSFYSVWQQYRGTLGNPIENVQGNDSGATYQLFENGSIVSSQNGTFPLYGAIRQKYLNEGGLNGGLGTPKSAEYSLGNGVIQQDFTNGYIIWNGQRAIVYYSGNGKPNVQTPNNTPKTIPSSVPAKRALSWGGVVDSSVKGSFVADILSAVNRGVIRQEVGYFLMSILATESGGGDWQANNGLGYLGAFQMGVNERVAYAPGISNQEFLANKDIQMKAAQGLYDEKLRIIANLAQKGELHLWTTEPDRQPVDEHFAGKSNLYKAAYAWLNLAGEDGNHVYSKDYARAADETAQLIALSLGSNSNSSGGSGAGNQLRPETITKIQEYEKVEYIDTQSERQNHTGEIYTGTNYLALTPNNYDFAEMCDLLFGSDVGPIHSAGGYLDHYDSLKTYHAGIDFSVSYIPVRSLVRGKVVYVATMDGKASNSSNPMVNWEWGTIAIYNSQLNKTFMYLHMNTSMVSEGDTVEAGQEIGQSGETGSRGVPHFHLEVKETAQEPNGNDVKGLTPTNDWKYVQSRTVNPMRAFLEAKDYGLLHR